MMTRKFTNRLLEMMDEGVIDAEDIVLACVKYMSEDEVKDMCEHNCFDEFMFEKETEEENA
jgi:hypothetical protein